MTLCQLASIAGLSRTYYCSVFKALNGITPWDYINIKRVEHSMKLLQESDETVLDIALQSGFTTQRTSTVFSKKQQDLRRVNTEKQREADFCFVSIRSEAET